jgi:hypothetical protein
LVLQRLGKSKLIRHRLSRLLIVDECVGDIAEGAVDGIQVLEQRFFALRFGGLVVSSSQASVEDECIDRSLEGISRTAPPDEAKQVASLDLGEHPKPAIRDHLKTGQR